MRPSKSANHTRTIMHYVEAALIQRIELHYDEDYCLSVGNKHFPFLHSKETHGSLFIQCCYTSYSGVHPQLICWCHCALLCYLDRNPASVIHKSTEATICWKLHNWKFQWVFRWNLVKIGMELTNFVKIQLCRIQVILYINSVMRVGCVLFDRVVIL